MKNLSWRWMLYLVVGGYLLLDLKVCHGPLRDAMRSPREAALAVARMMHSPHFRSFFITGTGGKH